MKDQHKTVTLKKAIVRGEQQISEIQLRKPNVPALKGLKLLDVMQSDVNSLIVLLPRITLPMLTKADIEQLDIADLTQLTGALFEVMGFSDDETEAGKPA